MSKITSEQVNIDKNDLSSHLEVSDIQVKAESSIFFEDKHDEQAVLLKFARSRPLFLVKLGFHFLVYYTALFLVLGYIHFKFDEAEQFAHQSKILELKWIILASLCGMKLFFGFFGFLMRGFSKVFFLIDILGSCWTLLGFYFYCETFVKDLYVNNGHFFYLIAIDLILCTLAFILTARVTSAIHPTPPTDSGVSKPSADSRAGCSAPNDTWQPCGGR